MHNFLFATFPYLVIIVFVTALFYRNKRQTLIATEEELKEINNLLSWERMPLQLAGMVIFLGHILAFIFSKILLTWNSQPIRLVMLEVTALVFALCLFITLAVLFIRRIMNSKLRALTNKIDVIVEILLLLQIFSGCFSAVSYRWGSSWFASNISPYLWSIIKFNPEVLSVKVMPHIIQTHIITGFIIFLLMPFTRFWMLLLNVFLNRLKNLSK